MPGVGYRVCDVLVSTDGNDLHLYEIVEYQDVGIGLEFVRHQNVAVGSLDYEGTTCAGIIDSKVEMVGGDLLDGGLRLGD